MMRRNSLTFLLVACACGTPDDTPETTSEEVGTASDEGESTTTTTTTTETSETSGDGDGDTATGDGDGTATGDGDGDGSQDPPPATGVQIADVTVDQGIRIPIVVNGSPVPTGQRILDDRPAVIRAFWTVDPGFATRDIYAVLTVNTGGVDTEFGRITNVSDKPCAGPIYTCHYGSLPTGAFWWRVPQEYIQPDTTFKIELMEAAPGHENDISSKVPIYPFDGTMADLGVDDVYMKMRVVLVPYYHDVGSSCPEAPDLNEEFGVDVEGNPRTVADYFGERLAAHNPAEEVEIIVHSVENWSGSLQNGSLLSELQQLRQWEGAPPGHYYYGVARPCNGSPDFAGIAQLGGPWMSEALDRVGWGVYYSNVGTTAETFVHEIGHEQGRSHIRCTGEEAGANTSYPDHPEGDTESYGMDVFRDPVSLSGPADHDYMTYCSGTWVSEWGWNLVYPWIETISSWENPDVQRDADASQRPVLIGSIREEGERWWITRTWFDDAHVNSDYRIQYQYQGRQVETAGRFTPYHETDDHYVVIPLPEHYDAIERLQFISPEVRKTIELEDVLRVLPPESSP